VKRAIAPIERHAMALLGLVRAYRPAAAVVPGRDRRILLGRAVCGSDAKHCWEIVTARWGVAP